MELVGLAREDQSSVPEETPLPPTEAVTETPVPMLLPGQVLYLTTTTPQTNVPVVNQEKPRRRKGGDGGGGGGGGGGGAADASTGFLLRRCLALNSTAMGSKVRGPTGL